ncbi:hypothetical protein SAMN04487894_10813 [Niabella drilacis]|uniref:DoxX-like family protein n=2 Tax=Niabella drilacis (strain DSM 25811 / CCM 8410 / CCUG 62505 / LMG 26954 / E90) TaxID=1285928 RepID=A0A1G6TU98_NIADE|nr:hypothetical protein SAMN04487894_10813 [Niabella drilacis]
MLKIINTVLILTAVLMGIKQGLAMLNAKTEMLELFAKGGLGTAGVKINGAITILAALLILFPKTFLWGNFIMAAGILLVACIQLTDGNIRGALIELPFLVLNLVIIYLQHPLRAR